MNPEERIASLGLTLPVPPSAIAAYTPALVSNGYVWVSGQVPTVDGALRRTGLVGRDIRLEEAVEEARIAALNAIAQLKSVAGDLSRVKRIVKLQVFVASSEGFHAQPSVANGASELFMEVFGDAGVHARSAVGVAALPLGATVEIDLVAELGDAPAVQPG
jgi:enamine deaminase RidA (YjgF/YER057c/UK114 family)